jgi:hypothetical protein
LCATKPCPSHEDPPKCLGRALGGCVVPAVAVQQGTPSRRHIILETSEPTHQRIAVPAHYPLRLGTFSSILRTVADHKGVPRDEIIATL